MSACQGACCLIFFLIIVASSFLSAFNTGSGGTSDVSSTFSLDPGTNKLIAIPNVKAGVEVRVDTGSAKSYFMSSAPNLVETSPTNKSYSSRLVEYEYNYYSLYMNEGTTINVSWSFAGDSDPNTYFYLIKGTADFKDFEDDYYFSYERQEYGAGGSLVYASYDTDLYYYVFYSEDGTPVTYNVTFEYTLAKYDTAGASEAKIGNFDLDLTDTNYQYMVIENDGDSISSGRYTLKAEGGGMGNTVIIVVMIVIGIVVFAIVYKKTQGGDNKQKAFKNGEKNGDQNGPYTAVSKKSTNARAYKPDVQTAQQSKSTKNEKSQFSTLNDNQVQKLKNLFRFSNRIKVEDLANVLHVKRNDLLDYLTAHPDVIEGFQLEGEYFEAKRDQDVGDFLESLDKEFDDWQEKEQTKEGKVENVLKFCEKCGTRIDPMSQQRLKQAGRIFCTNCGQKITLEN